MVDRPSGVPVARGDRLTLDVEAFGDGPDGLARIGGYIVFVPGAIPGERVRAEIVSAGRKHGRAELVEIERSAGARVEPRCRHFAVCGGCQLQHVDLETQRRTKTDRLRKTLSHALRTRSVPVEAMRGSEDGWGLRTKVALHFSGTPEHLVAGYFQRRSRELVGIAECPVSDPLALRVALAARDGVIRAGLSAWDPRSDDGEIRAVVARAAPSTQDVHLIVVVRREPRAGFAAIVRAARDAGATGVSIDRNDGPPERLTSGDPPRVIFGEGTIREEVRGTRMRVSPGAFFQTSSYGAGELVDVVRELHGATADGRIVDLYCGVGLFALALAPDVARVVAVDENEEAVEDARLAAEAAGIQNVTFKSGVVERLADSLARGRGELDAAIVDPPRAGLSRRVVDVLLQRLTPRRIVYVSCDPESLGRDLRQLVHGGYRLARVVPVDMFPHTHHIEAVAVLDRLKPRAGDAARRRLLAKSRTPP